MTVKIVNSLSELINKFDRSVPYKIAMPRSYNPQPAEIMLALQAMVDEGDFLTNKIKNCELNSKVMLDVLMLMGPNIVASLPIKYQDMFDILCVDDLVMYAAFRRDAAVLSTYTIVDADLKKATLLFLAAYHPEVYVGANLPITRIDDSWALGILYDQDPDWVTERIHTVLHQPSLRRILLRNQEIIPKLTVSQLENSTLSPKQFVLMVSKFKQVEYSTAVVEWLDNSVSLGILVGNVKNNTRVRNALGKI